MIDVDLSDSEQNCGILLGVIVALGISFPETSNLISHGRFIQGDAEMIGWLLYGILTLVSLFNILLFPTHIVFYQKSKMLVHFICLRIIYFYSSFCFKLKKWNKK